MRFARELNTTAAAAAVITAAAAVDAAAVTAGSQYDPHIPATGREMEERCKHYTDDPVI